MARKKTSKWDRLYEQLCAPEQLKTGLIHFRNAQETRYKNYYREVLAAYSLAEDENLSGLSSRLRGGSYVPRRPIVINVPRPDGLLRPTTLLHLDDLIVYEAVATVLAGKFAGIRKQFEKKSVFSNIG